MLHLFNCPPLKVQPGLATPQNPLTDLPPWSAQLWQILLCVIAYTSECWPWLPTGLEDRARPYLPQPSRVVGGVWIRNVADTSLTLVSILTSLLTLGKLLDVTLVFFTCLTSFHSILKVYKDQLNSWCERIFYLWLGCTQMTPTLASLCPPRQ